MPFICLLIIIEFIYYTYTTNDSATCWHRPDFFRSKIFTATICSRFLLFKLRPVSPMYTASQSRQDIKQAKPDFFLSSTLSLVLQKILDRKQTGFIATQKSTRCCKTRLIGSVKFCKKEPQTWFSFVGICFQSEQTVACDEILFK